MRHNGQNFTPCGSWCSINFLIIFLSVSKLTWYVFFSFICLSVYTIRKWKYVCVTIFWKVYLSTHISQSLCLIKYFACLHNCLSTWCLSGWLHFYLPAFMPICLLIWLFCLPSYTLSPYMQVWLPAYLSTYTCLVACLNVCPSTIMDISMSTYTLVFPQHCTLNAIIVSLHVFHN